MLLCRNNRGEAAAAALSSTIITTLKPRQILLSSKQSIKHNTENIITTISAAATDGQGLLVHSICQFPERYGFSKPSRRSAPKLNSSVGIGKVVCSTWKTCARSILSCGRSTEAILEEDGGTCSVASVENVLRKKKKKKTGNEGDEGMLGGVDEHADLVKKFVDILENNVCDNKLKEKRSGNSA